MDHLFIVKSLHYRPKDAADASWIAVDGLGFSAVRLMELSGREATGVRADLKIQDRDALSDLSRHYAKNARLKWRFDTGGGGGTFAVPLRWTKFDPETGKLQVVRTAVRRDLIGEMEQQTSATPSRDRRDRETDPASARPRASQQQITERKTAQSVSPESASEPQSNSASIRQQISAFLNRLLQRDGSPMEHGDHE